MLLVAVFATMALSLAAVANATVTVTDEATGEQCNPTCALHATGEIAFGASLIGLPITFAECLIELDGHVDADGEGAMEAFLFNHPNESDCDVTSCANDWEIHLEEIGPGSEVMTLEYCINDSGVIRSCFLTLPLAAGLPHDYEAVFQSGANGTNHANAPGCWIEGQIHFEGTDIEINH